MLERRLILIFSNCNVIYLGLFFVRLRKVAGSWLAVVAFFCLFTFFTVVFLRLLLIFRILQKASPSSQINVWSNRIISATRTLRRAAAPELLFFCFFKRMIWFFFQNGWYTKPNASLISMTVNDDRLLLKKIKNMGINCVFGTLLSH